MTNDTSTLPKNSSPLLRCIFSSIPSSTQIETFDFAVWTSDEQRIATAAAADSYILIWSAITGKSIQMLERSNQPIKSMSVSPDGKMLASVTDEGTVYIWDINSGIVIKTLLVDYEGYDGYESEQNIVWSPDGKTIAICSGPIVDLYAVGTWESIESIEELSDSFSCIAWSPNSRTIVLGTIAGVINIQEPGRVRLLRYEGHDEKINTISLSPNGKLLASGSDDLTIKIWHTENGRLNFSFEGPTSPITKLTWSQDGQLLAAASKNGDIRIWQVNKGEELNFYRFPQRQKRLLNISFSNTSLSVSSLSMPDMEYADLLLTSLDPYHQTIRQTKPSVKHISAKVVLVGESEVGKSCLARRLATNEYKEEGSTHGMRFWQMNAEQLDPKSKAPKDEQRDITIWDLGGQDEYRLVNQLFLGDTTLALMLFSPDRGEKAIEDVREWNLRLEKQKRRATTKLLIGAKADAVNHEIIDQSSINTLVRDCGMLKEWHLVSAKDSTGIAGLKSAISKAIDWKSLSVTTRPRLFQLVREAIIERQQRNEVVVLYSVLEKQIQDSELPSNETYDPDAVRTVVDQLERQGLIVDTSLSNGERVLLLQIGYIGTYAGALIKAAKVNLRGVPALEMAEIYGMKAFPGIKSDARLDAFTERIVIECVVQLLIRHGICLKHEGLLIFPSQFPTLQSDTQSNITQTVSLYYDFTGAIDNIYSSLVVKLALSERFGRIRLSHNQADYDHCGLRKVDRHSGFAHLDLLFSKDCSKETRDLFINFVEDHLQREGVEIKEVLEIVCTCTYKFDEALVKERIDDNRSDVICPRCESRHPISEGAKKAREKNPAIVREMFALKTQLEKRSIIEANEVKIELAAHKPDGLANLRILHLSDLHFGAEDDVDVRLYQLSRDLNDKVDGLGFDNLDYLVISGDLTNRATKEEFDHAYKFISGLIERFNLSAERCIIVPGNHDLSWDQEVYDWKRERLVNLKSLKDGSFIKEGKLYGLRDETKYPARFDNFSKFYHSLIQLPYPLQAESQCLSFLYDEPRLQFLTMNSAGEIDEWFQDRSSINDKALVKGLSEAERQIEQAKTAGRIDKDAEILRIAVWHHPVTGNEKIINDAFLEQLRKADVKLCLHGHVHEDRADLVGYLHPTRKLHIAGAGSFGAGAKERPASVPRLYNVLEIWRDHSKIRVHTRCLKKDGGAWEGWAVWQGQDNHSKRSYYEIKLK